MLDLENEQDADSNKVRIIRDTTTGSLTEEQTSSMKLLVMVVGLIVEITAYLLIMIDEIFFINIDYTYQFLKVFEVILFVGGILPFLAGFIPLISNLRLFYSANRKINEQLRIVITVLISLICVVELLNLYFSIVYAIYLHYHITILIWPPLTLVKRRFFMSFNLIANLLVCGLIVSISKLIKNNFEVKTKDPLHWSSYGIIVTFIVQLAAALFYLLATTSLPILDFVQPLAASSVYYLANVLFNIITIAVIINLEAYLKNTRILVLEGQ